MWKLHRYYLKELTVNAAITFTVLFAIVLLSLVARALQKLQGGSLLDVAVFMLLWALDAFPHLMTISFLLATVITFARAAQDRELVAIRSAGISPRVPMTAALLVGVVLSIGGSLANHYVLPAIHFRKYRITSQVMRSLIINMNLGNDRIRLRDFVMDFKRQDEDRSFRDCTIYASPEKMARLVASASPILKVDRVSMPPLDERSGTIMVLLEGLRDPVSGNDAGDVRLFLPLGDLTDERRNERDDDLTSDQLLSEVMRGVHEAPTAATYTLNRRSCFSLMPALLAPIGFCIAQLAYQRGRIFALVTTIVPLVVFYTGEVLGAKLLRTTDWPVFGWFPAILLLAFGVPFCIRMLRL